MSSGADAPATGRLTGTQREVLALLGSGAAVAVVRAVGARQVCRIVPNLMDWRWRRRHKGKPVQEHTLAGLVRRGLVVREVQGAWVVWRLRE